MKIIDVSTLQLILLYSVRITFKVNHSIISYVIHKPFSHILTDDLQGYVHVCKNIIYCIKRHNKLGCPLYPSGKTSRPERWIPPYVFTLFSNICFCVVDKLEQMLGSYGPNSEPYTKNFDSEESPSGILARSGAFSVRSRVVDDDGEVFIGMHLL